MKRITPLALAAAITSACSGGEGNVTSPPEQSSTLVVSIIGQGTVTSSPSGITCSSGAGGTCSTGFASGTSVTLTAIPAQDWEMSGWGGLCWGTADTADCVLSASVSGGSAVTATFTSPGVITSVAGSAVRGSGGDGQPATTARLNHPWGLAFDAAGNLYFVDTGNHRVRKVDASGVITTVAGTGVVGFSGDGDLASRAELNNPAGMAIDAGGNLYVADRVNHRVRKIEPGGQITTIAGTGPTGLENAGFAGDGGPASEARLNVPEGVAVDAACMRIRSLSVSAFSVSWNSIKWLSQRSSPTYPSAPPSD